MRLPDPSSLRSRLLALAALTIATTLIVAGLALSVIFDQYILRRVAEELNVRWFELAGLARLDAADRAMLERDPSDPRYAQPLSGVYWQLEQEGAATGRSRSLWDRMIEMPADVPADAFEVPGFEPGSELYVVARDVTLEGVRGPVTARLSVAIDHADVEVISGSFASDLAVALTAIATVLFAGAFLQSSVGLRPLRRLRRAIQAVRNGTARRLGGAFPTEVQPLVDDLDRLLDRHEQLVAKARDRAGMLAHGFKTPLTILALEAARLEERGASASARVVREQAEQMRRLVERELARSRVRGGVSSGSALGAEATTPVPDKVGRIVDLVRRLPHGDRLTFVIDVPPGLSIRMDADDFSEVAGNLLDNARKFAASGVRVRATVETGLATLEVSDDGPGFGGPVPEERAGEGAGLGLAIVDDVLAAYGARLERSREESRTVLRFRMPVAAGSTPPAGLGSAGARTLRSAAE